MSSKEVDIADTRTMENTSSNSRASQQRKEESLKIFRNKRKKKLQDIRDMLNPQINLVHKPQDDLERWALGTVYKTVYQGANKCISNAAVLEFYNNGHGRVKYYHTVLKKSGIKALANLPPTPKVRLNDRNITDVQHVLLEVTLSN